MRESPFRKRGLSRSLPKTFGTKQDKGTASGAVPFLFTVQFIFASSSRIVEDVPHPCFVILTVTDDVIVEGSLPYGISDPFRYSTLELFDHPIQSFLGWEREGGTFPEKVSPSQKSHLPQKRQLRSEPPHIQRHRHGQRIVVDHEKHRVSHAESYREPARLLRDPEYES